MYKWNEVLKISKEATNSQSIKKAQYQGEVQVGFGAGVGTLPVDRVYLQTIQGVRVNEYFSAGLGIGLNLLPSYEFIYNQPELYMPIFVNLKGYLPVNERTSMFASFDIGGAFGLTAGVTDLSGLYICPAVGVNVNNKVNISLGYDLQKISTGISNISVNMNAVAIKIGYLF